jgi:hypothetical protein
MVRWPPSHAPRKTGSPAPPLMATYVPSGWGWSKIWLFSNRARAGGSESELTYPLVRA